jgi:hypothetical protein
MSHTSIVGVTVGVGAPYDQLASMAALCFTKHTGLPAVVLGAEEFTGSQIAHPAALRLRLFDYVDADRVVYFDADWLCLRDWAPTAIAELSEVVACRDFILADEWPRQHYQFDSKGFLEEPDDVPLEDTCDIVRHDYINEVRQFGAISLPISKWINTGMLILTREHHSTWLRTALELYLGPVGHHTVYYEQPALVKAIELLDLPIRLLPRRFNVLAAYETKWPGSVVGLHIKVKRHHEFIANLAAGLVSRPDHVQAYFQAQ